MRLVTDTEGMGVGPVNEGYDGKIAGSGDGKRQDAPEPGVGPPVGPEWYQRPPVRPSLAARDVGGLYRALRDDAGLTQRQIAGRTGQSQSEVCEILAGRTVISYDVLARVAEGFGIPRELMGLSWWGPDGSYHGPEGTYPERCPVADTSKEASAEMLRRHLIALGGAAMVGTPVAKLGALLAQLPGPPPVPLPSRLSGAHVIQVRDLTQRLGAGDTHDPAPEVVSAAAGWAGRLLDVPGPEPVQRALRVAVAELHIEAGWSAFEAGLYRRALYHYARALELATATGDTYLQATALNYAGLASVEHGHPDDGLKMLQCAQAKAWDIPSDDQRAVVIGASGSAAAEACTLADSANALTRLGNFPAAATHLAKGRELWTPTPADPFGDMDRPAARLELARGHLDAAEALATASLRRWLEGKKISRALSGAVLATIHVKGGERNSLQLAHHTITTMAQLSSVRTRKQLIPLANALAARPGSDAAELTRMARQVATIRAG
ncbi:MAG: helix-turn-helix domain-containing protein [Pseudonocardiaceae bacterium]